VIIKTGDRAYCLIGEWADATAFAKAREKMIAALNTFSETLEDQGSGLGVTDAVSGSVVLDSKGNLLPPAAHARRANFRL